MILPSVFFVVVVVALEFLAKIPSLLLTQTVWHNVQIRISSSLAYLDRKSIQTQKKSEKEKDAAQYETAIVETDTEKFLPRKI